MTEDEIFEALEKETDIDAANRMYDLWKEDPTRDMKTLKALAGVGFGGKVETYTGKGRRPVTEAFGISEDQYRLLVDPNSPINWMTLPTKELMKAAIDGGYVQDIPKDASEEEKMAKRQQFGDFLRMLADESTLQGRRNAVREYEKTDFLEDPVGWAEKGINNLFFRTYQKRAKEQALKGEGATSWYTMNAGDAGALGGDIAVNSILGAGAGGISRAALQRGLGNYAGLRTFGNVAGSDLAAGVLGGLGSVANRAVNTDDGARGYEFVTEPAATGVLNTIATPAVLREGVGNVARLVGIGGAKLDNLGKRNLMQKAQRFANEKYAEPALASTLKGLDDNIARTYENSPVSAETQAQVNKMFDILNDGASNSPGKSTSLFDDLQTLYENSARKTTGMKGEMAPIKENDVLQLSGPESGRFRSALDEKISDIEGTLANSAGKEEAPALQRELSYYRNFRDMMDNGLIDADEYLLNKDAQFLQAPHSTYETGVGRDNVPFFELGKRASESDVQFMKDYIRNVNSGHNLHYDNGLATRVRELGKKYPEFQRYVESIETVPMVSKGANSLWPSMGYKIGLGGGESFTMPLVHETKDGIRAYGTKGFQDKMHISSAPAHPVEYAKRVLWDATHAPATLAKDVVGDVAKPAIVESRLTKYDKPDNSYETLEKQYNDLRARKPEAVDAAMSFKYDPRLESSRQLTMEERDLLDRFREAQRRKVLGD